MVDTSLLQYQILAELGRGGMGIVYRAIDTKLDRTVAVKVLPSAALASEDDRARFYREAKAAAALNHPNIAAIYQIDEAVAVDSTGRDVNPTDGPRPFIAMEFIEGETLHDRILKGPLKIDDAVRIAIEVADALKAAHAKNIVHRDIKSANIMLTPGGKAKVLDFGLAQTSASTKLTQMGSTLGTVAYMSPEQARGSEVDGRSDLYSLGTVLYEMIAGRLPFVGDFEQAVVYGILNEIPAPLTALRTGVPMGLEWVVDKCLAKLADDRYQSAADLIVDLKHVDVQAVSQRPSGATAIHSTMVSAAAPAASRKRTPWLAVAGALLFGSLLTFAGLSVSRKTPPPQALVRVDIPFPNVGDLDLPSLSPTGEYLAVQASDKNGTRGIYLRNMSTGEIRFMDGSEIVGQREMKFSPDGSLIAFTQESNGGLFVAVVPSGIPRRITKFGRLAFWEDDETLIMTDDTAGGGLTYRVRLDGGAPDSIVVEDPKLDGEYGNVPKTFVPGSPRAFGHQLVRTGSGSLAELPVRIYTVDLKSGNLDILESNAINPEYVHGGLLTYQLRGDDGQLLVRPINEKTGQFTGVPRDALPSGETAVWGQYTITPAGDLIYSPTFTNSSTDATTLWTVDMETGETKRVPIRLPDKIFPFDPRFSPAGNRIVFTAGGRNTGHIFVYDLVESVQYQYTFEGNQFDATFTPDGRHIAYTQEEGERPVVVMVPADNSAKPTTILEDAFIPAFSPDGRWMAATGSLPAYSMDLLLMDLRTGAISLLDTMEAAVPAFSPDNRYVVYQNSLSGIPSLIVRSVQGSERFPLPRLFGGRASWSPDGEYLYFGTVNSIRRLQVRTSPTFNVRSDAETIVNASNLDGFDLSSDGRTMVVAASQVSVSDTEQKDAKLVWLQNWSEHIRRELGNQ